MKNDKKIIVFLTGGLGNQLFQMSAAQHFARGKQVICELGFSGVRNPVESPSEMSKISKLSSIDFRKSSSWKSLTQIAFNYLLRISLKNQGLEGSVFWKLIVRTIASLYFSVYYRMPLVVNIGDGIGFSELGNYSGNRLIVGYFQSHKYARTYPNWLLSEISADVVSQDKYSAWIKRAKFERPFVVHVRLGDYLNEPKIGTVGRSYYKAALLSLLEDDRHTPIWVYSDSPADALNQIPKEYHNRITLVNDFLDEPAATLLLMRYGSGFVIANSTFSWWGAYSSNTSASKVYYPQPWFEGLDQPRDLIPDLWVPIPRDANN